MDAQLPQQAQQAQHLLPTSTDEIVTISTAKGRWHVLMMFCGISFINSFCWISFAPIPDYTTTFYSVDNMEVNLLSMSFMFFYLPGTLLSGRLGLGQPFPPCPRAFIVGAE